MRDRFAIFDATRQRHAHAHPSTPRAPSGATTPRAKWRGIRPRLVSEHATLDEARAAFAALPDVAHHFISYPRRVR